MGLEWNLQGLIVFSRFSASPWTWKCNEGKEVVGGHALEGRCSKALYDPKAEERQVGMNACKMTCNMYGMLWPKPTGEVELSKELLYLLPGDLTLGMDNDSPANLQPLVNTKRKIFREYLYLMHPNYNKGKCSKHRDI